MNARKLLLREKVEVRQIEDGLQGSWFSAVVIGVLDMRREVEYDELLCETEDSRLVETIPVTGEIEGINQRPCVKTNHRGRIRPRPPRSKARSVKSRLRFGFCVDVLLEDAWWEGVVFDNNVGSDERSVYFPDEGDKQIVKVSDLRITHEWDEFSGDWKERGVWTLVKLVEESQINNHLSKFTEFVWSHLRGNYGFHKMISEWTCGAFSLWKVYFLEVISALSTRSLRGAICYPITSEVTEARCRGNKSNMSQWPKSDGSLSTKTYHRRNERKACQSIKSKKLEKLSVHEAGSRISQTDALSEKGLQTNLKGASSHEGDISDVCSVLTNEIIEKTATTSDRSVPGNKKQPQPQAFLSRRKVQQIKRNSEAQKLNPFVVHQKRLHRCRGSSQKHMNVASSLCSLLHVKKTRHLLQRQSGRNTATRFPRCCQRVVSFDFKKKKSCLKVNKRFPKKLRRSNAKRRVSCTEEGSHSELKLKEGKSFDEKAAFQQEFEPQDTMSEVESRRSKRSRKNDTFCFVCHYGDDLLPCDNCTSSYHMTCTGLKEVPSGDWFCPSCRCGLCGLRNSIKDDLFTEVCYQCSRQYHLNCLNNNEDVLPDKFCSKSCFEICAQLHDHLQALYSTPVEGLSWTLVRSRRNDYNIRDERLHPHVQLSEVMKVLHECFEPTIEPHSKKDLVVEVVYNSGSKFKRLDFHGFYVMVLLQGEEIASVATLRIHGHKVAEMPLVATPFKYRRKGMCRLLVREMEKMLIALGVERLVLPAISQLRETWIRAFGFEEMPDSLREDLAGYPFLVFSGTSMFHKVLCEPNLTEYTSNAQRETKSNTAGAPQEQEDNCCKRRSLCYKLRQRPENVNKDQMAKQKLNDMRIPRPETRSQKNSMTQGLCHTRRRRLKNVSEEKMTRQGTDTDSSPVNNVYKRRRVLATREDVH